MISPSARDIAILARYYAKQKHWVSAEQALPVYLRDNAWKKIAEQGKAEREKMMDFTAFKSGDYGNCGRNYRISSNFKHWTPNFSL
jgi:hypothetical protein